MNILPKSFITAALAVVVTAAAFTAATSSAAEAGRKAHFRHAVKFCHNTSAHPGHCFNRVYNRFVSNGYSPAYVPGYNLVNACGWKVITRKNWNPAHTRLTIVKNKVWTCY